MYGIKFVPTSEWQVQRRTEECAERTWEREQSAASRCLTNVGIKGIIE
ncbi:MAG: hypothetical protein IJA18_03955 [Ruminococcus sp.]|nr:hypothetical protein [Ruminococcus sp.]